MIKKSFILFLIFGFCIAFASLANMLSLDPQFKFLLLLQKLALEFTAPLLASAIIFATYWLLPKRGIFQKVFAYLLFFSISVASLMGLTAALTGSHAVSTNPFIYGLSFYTAYLAHQIITEKIHFHDVFIASNPMLLFTGPIAVIFKSQRHKSLLNRLNYFIPFFITGLFFYKIIGVPLTNFFWLIEFTSFSEVILFGIIFELFIYFNFCGLSFIVYSIFGIFGIKIPLNFKQPFSSRNIIEFWRGWHRSLSSVLRVLFYLPIKKYLPTSFALLGVYLASALWHGVTFNFILWGVFHAASFIITIKLLKLNFPKLATIIMFFAIIYGRVIFADSNTPRLLEKLIPTFISPSTTFDSLLMITPMASLIALFFAVSWVVVEFIFQDTKYLKQKNYKLLRLQSSQFILVLIFLMLIGSSTGIDYAAYGQR
jgi:alginate O-acetyltransferase complex protein AlgI